MGMLRDMVVVDDAEYALYQVVSLLEGMEWNGSAN